MMTTSRRLRPGLLGTTQRWNSSSGEATRPTSHGPASAGRTVNTGATHRPACWRTCLSRCRYAVPSRRSDVSTVKSNLDQIKRGLLDLQKANEESKTATQAKKMKELRARMEKAVQDVTTRTKETKDQLEALDKANEDARKKKGCGAGSVQDRTRTGITLTLRKKLSDLLASFSELREKLQNEYKEVVERRYQAIHGKKARPPRARPPRARRHHACTELQCAVLRAPPRGAHSSWCAAWPAGVYAGLPASRTEAPACVLCMYYLCFIYFYACPNRPPALAVARPASQAATRQRCRLSA